MQIDYYQVLRHAIDAAGQPDEAERYAIYERARQTLVKQLRGAEPPLSDAQMDVHVDALHAAVKRIENEFTSDQSRWAPPVPQAPVSGEEEPWTAPPDPTAPQRRTAMFAAVAAAAVLVAGLGAYFIVTRDRPTSRVETAAPPQVAAPVSTKNAPAASANSATTAKSAPPAKGAAAQPAAEQASYVLRQQRVYYRTTQPVGSIVISRNQRFLYVVQPNNVAIRYAIAIGRECENIAGLFRVSEKIDRAITIASDKAAQFDPPALYFGDARAVHKATDPALVGQSVNAGCFQALDTDMADLFGRIPLNERIVVAN